MATSTFIMFTFLFLLAIFTKISTGDDDLYSVVVEHSFDSGHNAVFERRGVIEVSSLKSSQAEYTSEFTFSEDMKSKLKELSKTNGIYRVRVGKLSSDEKAINYVYTFIKACSIYESRLSDTITIHVDQWGTVLAVSLTAPTQYCTGSTPSPKDLDEFNTAVEVLQSVNGPAPESQAYIQKLEQEKQERTRGQQGDNRSFFAKYWMYLVPLVIFMMLLNNVDPNAGQGGGGGGSRS